jgi:hypothetical protein
MSATYKIRLFAARLAPDEIFHTSQLLSFGTRWAVDQALCRMVQAGTIHRLARGLFISAGPAAALVTLKQAAEKKVEAFGNKIVEHATDAAYRLGIGSSPNLQPTFATSGSSSSFLFNDQVRVHFRRASAKKRKLSDSTIGDVIRSLWNLGETGCSREAMMAADQFIGRSDRRELPSLAGLMPTWLHCRFKWRAGPAPKRAATAATG